ncbi:MAG: hypothetical protein QOJ25_1464 [Solirubrobacteraceae bacterium]|jgi:hypothetical protein|nr:hypothetical protein [Solirubrobacteraceae bacterium]
MYRLKLGLVISGVVLVGAATAALAAGTRTHAVVFEAFTAAGTPALHVTSTARGTCNEGSSAIDRDDAWRCFAGNFVYDPCFSSIASNRIVLCPAGPWSGSGVEIKLASKLAGANRRKASTSGNPWAIQTTSGLRCQIATGATAVLDHRRANYFCRKSKDILWGSPSRKSEPWTIFAAPLSARRLTRRVGVRVAWF